MELAVDVMGGDKGCRVVIDGVFKALAANPGLSTIHLVGNQEDIKNCLSSHPSELVDRIQIQHTSVVLAMDEKPVAALRKKKDSSLTKAIDLVRDGRAQGVISTGNTGGLVAVSTVKLRTLEGIDRPAIATVIPTATSEFVLLDSGATPDCKPIHLLQFAIMGSVYARQILSYSKPRVGILSNGTEEIKGTETTREALKWIRESSLNFVGYVEGHDLFDDKVDVVVTDGFTGNIVLKTCESMGKAVVQLLKSELSATPMTKLGAWLARSGFRRFRRTLDPDAYGGAPLLGLNGNIIKAHGSASETAIFNAIRVAIEFVQNDINQIILKEIHDIPAKLLENPKVESVENPSGSL